jgi:CO dehydrogenase/acetyl-CoA synthase alpha subunit
MKNAFVVVLCLMAVPAVSLAADGISPGLWEITTQMNMPGMPAKMKPMVIKHCYTKNDAADQKNVISRDKNCTVTDMKKVGNKVVWAMKCTGQNAGTMNGETVFGPDSYTSTMDMKAQGRKVTMKVKGKRLGACK